MSVSSSAWRNFLNWSFGYEERWAVQCVMKEPLRQPGDFSAVGGGAYRRWVKVTDGRELEAFWAGHKATLRFAHGADLRSVRGWLRDAPRPFVQKLELTDPEVENPHGELCFIRTALPGSVSQPVEVFVGGEILESFKEANDQVLSRWQSGSLLVAAKERLVLVSSPTVFREENGGEGHWVRIHLSRGGTLHCLVRDVTGGQFLELRGFETTGSPVAHDARLVRVPEALRFVTEEPSRGTDLQTFSPSPHPHLGFWIEYERQHTDREKEQLERRQAAPLEYDEITQFVGANHDFWVKLVNGAEALEHWIEASKANKSPRSGTIKLDAEVAVRSLDKPETVKANLVELREGSDERVRARLVLSDKNDALFAKGKITAVESRGNAIQRKRRSRALERLRSGATACPDLLSYLHNPSDVPEIRGKSTRYHRRPGNRIVPLELQRDAVTGAAKEPAIFLIQGPPGTGKTFVISEIVEQLRHRYRNRQKDGVSQPFKVLVSSVQNEAVRNVRQRLTRDGSDIYIHSLLKEEVEGATQQIERGREAAARVEKRLGDNPCFTRYRTLKRLQGTLRLAFQEVSRASSSADLVQRLQELLELASNADALTPSLARDLTGAVEPILIEARDLDEAKGDGLDNGDQVGDGRDEPEVTVGGSTLLGDTLAELASLKVSSDNLPRLEALLQLLDTVADIPAVEDSLWTAGAGWSRIRRAVTRALDRKALPGRLEERWQNARRQTRDVINEVLDTPPKTPSDIEEKQAADGFESLTRALLPLLERAVESVSSDLEELEGQEEAVLYEWWQALRQEPKVFSQLERKHAPMVLATCSRSSPKVDRGVGPDDYYDVAIIEEAARAGLDILIPMSLARSIILVGDHQQLPPFLEKELVQRIEQHVVEDIGESPSLFKFLRESLPMRNFVPLCHQYRMHEDIGRLVSRVFYEPEGIRLTHHFSGERARRRCAGFGLFDEQPVVWVDTADGVRKGVFGSEGRWPYAMKNEYEVEVIVGLLRVLDGSALESTNEVPIGVITFYNDQVAILETALAERLPGLKGKIRVGTVDSFQGREFPLVILSCVRSNDTGWVGFLNQLPQRINVALSRAQSQLVIVGDSSTLCHPDSRRGSPWLRQVYEILDSGDIPGRIVKSLEVSRG